jgi:hypothetical protein
VLTNHASKGLHHQTRSHHHQQISSREVRQPPPVETPRERLTEEHNIRLYMAVAAAAAL